MTVATKGMVPLVAAEAEAAPHTTCFVRGQLPIPRHLTRCSYSDGERETLYMPQRSLVNTARKDAQFLAAFLVKNVWFGRRVNLDTGLNFMICYFL